MTRKPLTLSGLLEYITIEFVASALVATFFLGVIWYSFNDSIATAQAVAEKSAEKAAAVEEVVNEIKSEVEVIKANQVGAAQIDALQTSELIEQRKDIKIILRAVGGGRLDYEGGNG